MKKEIRLNFSGRCRICAGKLDAGEFAYHDPDIKSGSRIWHRNCDGKQATVLASLAAKVEEKKTFAAIENLSLEDKTLVQTLVDRTEKVSNDFTIISREFDEVRKQFRSQEGRSVEIEEKLSEIEEAAQYIIRTQEEMKNLAKREIRIQVANLPVVDMGLQHMSFPQLLRACSAKMPDNSRLSVWLTGPAGSGKTTAARNVAKALELPFYFTGSIDTEYKLLGFTGANGQIVSRPFRDAWTKGGVFLMDEIDGSLPPAVLALNAALANGICDFPDGAVERHPDCVVIAAANTWGKGATSEYVGRTRLDAASLDRFVQIEWPIDELLEKSTAPIKSWCARVQRTRKKVLDCGLKHMVTPRATYYGSALLSAGFDEDEVANMVLRRNLSDSDWKQIDVGPAQVNAEW